MSLVFIIELSASIATILQIWLYGNKTLAGPTWGIVATILWSVAMVITPIWGMAPLNLFGAICHTRNWFKWHKEMK